MGQLAWPSPDHPCPPFIGPKGQRYPLSCTLVSQNSPRQQGEQQQRPQGSHSRPLASSLVNWALRSWRSLLWMLEEGRERWGLGGREPEKKSCLLSCSVCSVSGPAPSALDPRGCCSQGSHSWNSGPGRTVNGILAKLGVLSEGKWHSGSGGQKEGPLCPSQAV